MRYLMMLLILLPLTAAAQDGHVPYEPAPQRSPSGAGLTADCPTAGQVVTYDGASCVVLDGCVDEPGVGACALTDCDADGLPVACCSQGGVTTCSAGAVSLIVEQDMQPPPAPEPSWWDEVAVWWGGLWRADSTVAFDFEDGTRWVSIEGDVSGGVFSPVYAAGGNDNANSGQDCAGVDNARCFLALTLAWSNAYSNSSGPAGFVLTSTDGAVRLACDRGPVVVAGQAVPMAVHNCSTAWQTGAVWAAPTACSGPQGTDLGACVGYAFEQAGLVE